MSTPIVSLIVARADNGVIGANGTLPWRLSDDMKHFKALTMGKPCIMGRKTWESLPRKPLPGRTNIVLTRRAFPAEGAMVVHSLDEAFEAAAHENPSEVMIIGGADIFAAALPLAQRIYLTEVHAAPEGDVRMPAFASQNWRETSRETHTDESLAWSYVTLERR